jgi:putative transposase
MGFSPLRKVFKPKNKKHSMPFVKIYIHCVWSTKYRYPHLNTKELRLKVWKHIKENAEKKGIHLDQVNGYEEHCHCLISLRSNQNVEKVMQLLKGESSFWINKNGLKNEKFEWQDEYYAVSVSESVIEKVRNYIKRQEEHHRKKSYSQECEELHAIYGFPIQ